MLVEPGDTAVFECLFTANPVMYDGIRWYGSPPASQDEDSTDIDDNEDDEVELGGGEGQQQGRMATDWEELGGSGGVRARLLMRNVTVGDAGRIHCIVGNGIGEPTRRTTFLLVKGMRLNNICTLYSTT